MYGSYLKAAREKARISPAEMAAAIGYKGTDMIYKIERDAADASLEQLDKWAAACGQLVGDILPNSGPSTLDAAFQPLIHALLGLSEEEIREQILILASQSRLMRNAILRRIPTTPQVVEERTTEGERSYKDVNESERADDLTDRLLEGGMGNGISPAGERHAPIRAQQPSRTGSKGRAR